MSKNLKQILYFLGWYGTSSTRDWTKSGQPTMGHENVQKVKHFLEFIILVAKEYRMSSERPDYLTGVACGYGTDGYFI